MILVEGLGWRVSAICQLRACDVELRATRTSPHGRLFKRPETDKEEIGGWIPMSAEVRAGVDRILAANPAIGEWPLFPAPRATAPAANGKIPKPWTRHYARALLERAEKRAKLDKIDGGDFHPYRRKWATERKHLPDVDVARAGGWSARHRGHSKRATSRSTRSPFLPSCRSRQSSENKRPTITRRVPESGVSRRFRPLCVAKT